MEDGTKKCSQVKQNGQQCQANVIVGSEFCFFHDPTKAEERKKAQAAGGAQNRAPSLPLETPDLSLRTTQEVAQLLGQTINQVRRGEIDPRIGNAIGYLSGVLLKAQEQGDIIKKLQMLEDTIRSGHRWESSSLNINPFSEQTSFGEP